MCLMAFGFSQGLFAFENKPYQDILKEKFNSCELKKENVYLTEVQKKKIETKLESKVSAMILRYFYPCKGSYVYVDSHFVRTLNETTVVEVNKEQLNSIHIASFMEPKEYLPPRKWLDKLALNQKVDGLTGATLSQNAILRVVDKYKVVNQVLNDKE